MNRIAFQIGKLSIYWYSIFVVLGILFALFIIMREVKRQQINTYFFTNLIFYTLLFGILGARLYYVLFNLDYYLLFPLDIIKIWQGGLAIHGGIIAGLITMIVYCKKYKVNILKTLDISCVGLIIGQAIGRWGNFFNQEAHGSIVTKDFLKNIKLPQFIIDGMYIDGSYYHPTFLYESIWCLIGFVILLFFRRRQYNKVGQTIAFYMIWYSIGRFFIESLRTDSLMIGNFKIAQIISIIMIITGIIIIIYSKKGSTFDNLYNRKSDNIKF